MVFRRRPRLSTKAPACSDSSRLGSETAAARNPTWAGEAPSASTAVSGRAMMATWSPRYDTVEASQ